MSLTNETKFSWEFAMKKKRIWYEAQIMDVTVDQAIENIWDCKSEEDFLDVTLTLLKLIQNVLFNPDKPKFKKIKRNTAVRAHFKII